MKLKVVAKNSQSKKGEKMKKLVAMLFLASVVTLGVSNTYAAENFLEGLTLGGGITLVLQNLQNSNVASPADENSNPLDPNKAPTLGQFSVDLEIEKKFDENNTAFFHLETGKGNIGYYLDSVASVNRDADDSGVVSITEAWFEHKFTDAFAVSAGVLDATTGVDENAYANDETSQFIGEMFRNAVNIGFADNNFGIKATYETDIVDVAAQYIGSNENSNNDITRNGFVSAQLNFKPGIISDMDGNYRIYGWTDTNDYAKFDGTGNGKEKDYGCGISIDQQLSNVFGFFGRYSWERGDVDNGIGAAHVWSAGLQINLKGIGDEDTIGLAYGQIIPSNEYKEANTGKDKSENHAEIYYSWNIADYLSISPDFQMVENPYYDGEADTAYVGTLRMQISF